MTDRPAFRLFLLREFHHAEALCRDPEPSVSAGGCPAFVALAARLGRLDQAWLFMLAVNRPRPDWQLPKRCPDGSIGHCAAGEPFRNYPDALEALLKAEKLIPLGWHPPG